MVADKEFYYSTYHGKLSEADVEGCLARAEYMLHSLTLDRLQDGAWQQDETLAKCVRMAHCALADAQHAKAWENGAAASSRMTNDPAASSAAACVSPPNISPSAAGCCTGG